MSACFICSVLELPKEKSEPDWKAARAHVKGLTERQLAEKFIVGLNLDISDELNNREMISAVLEDFGFGDSRTKLRTIALDAIRECEEMWGGNAVGGSIELSSCKILVAGESSWGDEPEGVTSISRFDACGAAKAAGFLV